MLMIEGMRFRNQSAALAVLWVLGQGLWNSPGVIFAAEGEAVVVSEEGMEAVLFAPKSLVQHPVAAAVDGAGRLMVVENQTQGRPQSWKGPEQDQVVVLIDENGDDVADRREVFFAGSAFTNDIAQGPEGWVYLVTRNEILRVRDGDGDGRAEQVERRLIWMETDEGVPAKGLTGLAFDQRGGFVFGMGENGGKGYQIRGADGMMFEDQCEGGQVWRAKLDGSGLKRVATGFYEPAGLTVDGMGEVFVTDAGWGADWPSRLLHVGEGWDFGVQDRYASNKRHPFLAWDGSRLGTMPMVGRLGERPEDLVWYSVETSPMYRGLPVDQNGSLLVAMWGEHRVERCEVARRVMSGTFGLKRETLCQGGAGFWPVGLAARKDGAIYVLDWAGKGGEMDGAGAVWLIRKKEASPLAESPKWVGIADPVVSLCETILVGPAATEEMMLEWLASDKPVIYRAAIRRLSRDGVLAKKMAAVGYQPDPRVRVGLLLAARLGTEREGVDMNSLPTEVDELLRASLLDADPEVSLPALHWVADHRIKRHRFLVRGISEDPQLNEAVFVAALTALDRIDRPEEAVFSEERLKEKLMELISDEKADVGVQALALRVVPGIRGEVTPELVLGLLKKAEDERRVWMTHFLGQMSGDEKGVMLRGLAFDAGEITAVRAAALTHVTMNDEDVPLLLEMAESAGELLRGAVLAGMQGLRLSFDQQKRLKALEGNENQMAAKRVLGEVFVPVQRPAVSNLAAWKGYLERLEGEPDVEQGRQVFLSQVRGGCAVCHHAEGLGNVDGLSIVGEGEEASGESVLESLLQPNRQVGTRGSGWTIVTGEGESHLVFEMVGTGEKRRYMDMKSRVYEWGHGAIAKREAVAVTVMPGDLTGRMTDVEIRHLAAYLEALRKAR
jgi:putative membrane-bound dehydrogenase-like protein